MAKVKGLLQRLRDGDNVICGEGYLWELERRGYLKSGVYTPETVLEHPEQVTCIHEEMVHAGSDVVEAFTYNGHRERLGLVGRAGDVEQLNLTALRLARDVADRTGTLMAGNLCNSTIYDTANPDSIRQCKAMFKEQVEWAVQGRADYIIAETFKELGEAKLALEAIKLYGNGLPAVVTLGAYVYDVTIDDVPIPDALRQLEKLGADVVGLNCGRGPATMLPLLRECRKVCKGYLAALPVVFRTSEKEKSFQALRDPDTGKDAYPLELGALYCGRSQIRSFAEEARKLGVQYIGLCCGNAAHYLREIALAYGRSPNSAQYAPEIRHCLAINEGQQSFQSKVQMHLMGRRSNVKS